MEECLTDPQAGDPTRWDQETDYLHALVQDLDQLALVVSQDLGVDIVVISIVQDEILYTIGLCPSPGPTFSGREQVLSDTICARILETDARLDVSDARKDPELRSAKLVQAGKIVGYLGVPIHKRDQSAVGVVSCITTKPRTWSTFERRYLEQVARNAELIMFRGRTDLELNALVADLSEMDQIISALSSQSKMPVSIYKPNGELVFVNAELAERVPIEFVSDYWLKHVPSQILALNKFTGTALPEPIHTTTKVAPPGQAGVYTVSIAISTSGLVVCSWFQRPSNVALS